MTHIHRALKEAIAERITGDNRHVLLFGARQTGKTTLAQELMEELAPGEYLLLSGEDPRTAEQISSCDLSRLRGILAGYRYVLLDEAQHIPDVGRALKIIHDNRAPDLLDPRILVTGSSSLSLAGGTREALTGRTWSFVLYPIAFMELAERENPFELHGRLPEALVLGMYPALFSLANRRDRVEHLRELSNAYLYRDVLELGDIRNPRRLRDLLRLLAYQVGAEVSYQELGRQVGLSTDTVISYIDLLEKAYVVFRLGAFSRNLRKEISRKDKIYFYDNGVRNILIEDTKEWHLRGDRGALWENFLVSERRKTNAYIRRRCNSFFWRVYTGAEIDYVEEGDGEIRAYEFKVQQKRTTAPRSFLQAYPGAQFHSIHMENWLEFVLG
ncbi:MAG: ATP-binding protein [Spirochaetaceae bacterium]|nr:MAG: ATP-binding protein [Spirochaetaceae bacterium]